MLKFCSKSCIVGDFDDDLDMCELFCRIEFYCEAWLPYVLLSQRSAPHVLYCIVGDINDDLDVCELFCRIELYCEAWMNVLQTRNTAHWNRGQCTARGPPNPDTWLPVNDQYHISGRKSFGNC